MAETAVGIVTDKLISLLRDEVSLLKGVHSKVEWVKDELFLIQAFLKDADAKAENSSEPNHAVKAWVKQLRDVAYRTEDVVDLYLLKVAERRNHGHHRLGFVVNICFCIKTIIPRHEISSEIDEITGAIKRLTEAKETLELSPNALPESGPNEPHGLRMGAHFIDEEELVGVDKTREELTDQLLNGESKRRVIAVVGEGGLGKTTIVKNLYEKQKERKSFECYAWINVSRSLKGEHLLKAIITAMEISGTDMSKEDLIKEIKEYLRGRSYMIVFDDVREQDFWVSVQFALPHDSKARIIITTRDAGVAEFCKPYAPVYIYMLKPLPPKDGLELFLKKAFPFNHKGCSNELEELSRDFVDKCEGVPLAIEAIAGLLSTKNKTLSAWQKVYGSLRLKLSSDPHLKSFYQVLSESYHDLPYHLKSCLLCFALFPEDYLISCGRLARLWIAEGFIKEDENNDQTLEETADDYLSELIQRNLVKLYDKYIYSRFRSCRVHDLMHAFIVRKCGELKFCQVMKNEEPRCRRISFHGNLVEHEVESYRSNYGQIRSCFVCGIEELKKPVVEMLSSFKLLVALDFENSHLDHLPQYVGMLLNLKYLNLRNTKIKVIPKFIGKLQNLETLDLQDTEVRELPKEINKLIKLRHLLVYPSKMYYQLGSQHGVLLNKGVGCLTALQSLARVDTIDQDDIIEELKNLKRMRVLAVRINKTSGSQICNAIKKMPHLSSLSISAVDNEERGGLELQSLVDPPLYLQRLYLIGHLKSLPEWILKLKHLGSLTLSWSRLAEDPLLALKNLPALIHLCLFESYEGVELCFLEGWFPKLKLLRLQSLPSLRTLKFDEKALPYLEDLELGPCPQMVKVPANIQNLESLKYLTLIGMRPHVVEDIKTRLKENIWLYVRDNFPM